MINIFDEVAPSWYNLRHRSIFRWELEELAQRWQTGNLLNIGCAHGPDFLPFVSSRPGGIDLTGVDFSTQMLRFARKYSMKFDFVANLVLADVRHLPFADGVFDRAISVATYHHRAPGGSGGVTASPKARRRSLYHGVEPLATPLLAAGSRSNRTMADKS